MTWDDSIISYTDYPTDSSRFTVAETQIGEVAFPAVAGGTYVVRWTPLLQSSVPDDVIQVTLREDSAAGAVRAAVRAAGWPYRRWETSIPSPGGPLKMSIAYQLVATVTGPMTFVATAHRVRGTGSIWRTPCVGGAHGEHRFRVHLLWAAHDEAGDRYGGDR